MIKIDKNVQMPLSSSQRASYPFDQMEVGDSFVVSDRAQMESARVSTYKRYHSTGQKFATRRLPEGLRIWRIA